MQTPDGDDAVDASSDSRPDDLEDDVVECCHHGVPFTEDCEHCEIEDEIDEEDC